MFDNIFIISMPESFLMRDMQIKPREETEYECVMESRVNVN